MSLPTSNTAEPLNIWLTYTSPQHPVVALAVFQLQYSELSSTTSAVWDGCGVEIESLPKFCKDPEHDIGWRGLILKRGLTLNIPLWKYTRALALSTDSFLWRTSQSGRDQRNLKYWYLYCRPSKHSSGQGDIIAGWKMNKLKYKLWFPPPACAALHDWLFRCLSIIK